MPETRWVFEKDGRLFREDITRNEIAVTEAVVNSMTSNMAIKIPGIVDHPKWGVAGLCTDSRGLCWWTIKLKRLMLRCPYRALDGGVLVPALNDEHGPVLTREWAIPSDMRIVVLICTARLDPSLFRKEGPAYLFCLSGDGEAWRLPIGNLYDDCHLCLGAESFRGLHHLEVVGKVLDQFELSEWNADLWTGSKPEFTRNLFSFKAKNEGFEQLPIEGGHWSRSMYKVSVAITEKIAL